MLLWALLHTGVPCAVRDVGAKPPWNQPQVIPLALSRSPTFLPAATPSGLVVAWLPSEHWS